MWWAIIFQSTLVYSRCNLILFNQKSTGFVVFKPKYVTINFQAQSFEVNEESIAAGLYSDME